MKKRTVKRKAWKIKRRPKIRLPKRNQVKIKRKPRNAKIRKRKIKNRQKRKKISRKPKKQAVKVLKLRHIKAAKVKPVAKNLTYVLNTDFGSFFELRDLILKSLPAEKDTMIERINKLGKVKLAIISGVFMNKDSPDPYIPDLLIVGDDLDKRKLRSFLKAIEAEVGKEIKFVILDKEEFQYRWAMFDRFIRVLLEGPHEKLINKLGI